MPGWALMPCFPAFQACGSCNMSTPMRDPHPSCFKCLGELHVSDECHICRGVQTPFEKEYGCQTQVLCLPSECTHFEWIPSIFESVRSASLVLTESSARSASPVPKKRLYKSPKNSIPGPSKSKTVSAHKDFQGHPKKVQPQEQSMSQEGLLTSEPKKDPLRPIPETMMCLSVPQAQEPFLMLLTPKSFEAAWESFNLSVLFSPAFQELCMVPTLEPRAPVVLFPAPERYDFAGLPFSKLGASLPCTNRFTSRMVRGNGLLIRLRSWIS